MSELRANAQALTALLRNPDADAEQIRELADDLAGAFTGAPEWPTPEQAHELVRLMALWSAKGPVQVTFERARGLSEGYLIAQVIDRTDAAKVPFTCDIAPDGRVSS